MSVHETGATTRKTAATPHSGIVAASGGLPAVPSATTGRKPLSGGGVGPGSGSRCRPGALPPVCRRCPDRVVPASLALWRSRHLPGPPDRGPVFRRCPPREVPARRVRVGVVGVPAGRSTIAPVPRNDPDLERGHLAPSSQPSGIPAALTKIGISLLAYAAASDIAIGRALDERGPESALVPLDEMVGFVRGARLTPLARIHSAMRVSRLVHVGGADDAERFWRKARSGDSLPALRLTAPMPLDRLDLT